MYYFKAYFYCTKSYILSKKIVKFLLCIYLNYVMIKTQSGGGNVEDIKNAIQLVALIIGSVVTILTGVDRVLSIVIKVKQLNRK